MRNLLLVGWLAAAMATVACEEAGGGPPYTCQPLCKSPGGSLLGSDKSVTVHANDQDEASDICAQQTNGDTMYCPSGNTVERCSCDL